MAFPLINVRFILLISASFIAIFSSIAIYFCLPILISHMIRTQITLSTTSGSYNNWRLNSAIDRIYLYNITNLNDLHGESAASSGESSGSRKPRQGARQVPKLKQIGPFTFRQDREKLNIKFDTTNETVIYDQKKSWIFLPELSSLKSSEEMRSAWVNHVSVPLAGTTLNPEYGEFIDPIVAENDLRLFLNHSVDALLFEGYFDILMEQAKASGQVDVDRFGWMHNQNNSVVRSIRVFTGPSNATLDKFGLIDQFDHKRQMSIWHNNNTDPRDFIDVKCNEFRLSSAGEFYPPPEYSIINHNYYKYTQRQLQMQQQQQQQENKQRQQDNNVVDQAMKNHLSLLDPDPTNGNGGSGSSSPLVSSNALASNVEATRLKVDETKRGKSISLFMSELCRTIRLFYNGSYYFKDLLLVDRYIANEQTFMYPTNSPSSGNDSLIESNRCFCNYNETSRLTTCPPNGMMDLFPCRKGSPISISFPHFLYSTKDKSLEPYLRLFSDDVEANEKEHQFFIDLETTLNVPVNVQVVLQFNVRLRNDQEMNFTKEYVYLMEDPAGDISRPPLRDIYLPQMWVKSTAEVDDTNLVHLRFIQQHLKLVTPLTTMVIFGFASILLMASAKLAYDLTYGPQSARKSSTCDHESCSSLNGSHSCSYLDEKKKYFDMQALAQSDQKGSNRKSAFNFAASMSNIATSSGSKTNLTNQLSFDDLNRPTTSKKISNFVISTPASKSQNDCCESEPLNG